MDDSCNASCNASRNGIHNEICNGIRDGTCNGAADGTQGIRGWEVLDCAVTLTRTGFASPLSAAGDFRNVTPLVVGDALKRAGTRVFEPTHRFELEAPVTSVGAVSALPAGARAVPEEQSTRGDRCLVRGTIPAAELHGVTRRLPESSRGEGVLVSEFEGYRAFTGHPIPIRARTGPDPYDRDRYMLHTLGRVRGS